MSSSHSLGSLAPSPPEESTRSISRLQDVFRHENERDHTDEYQQIRYGRSVQKTTGTTVGVTMIPSSMVQHDVLTIQRRCSSGLSFNVVTRDDIGGAIHGRR